MSEVTDAPRRVTVMRRLRQMQGGFIWYELMTTDAAAAGSFYSAVVKGWTFGERVPTDVDYRMIQRSDGGNAGGVLTLTDEMQRAAPGRSGSAISTSMMSTPRLRPIKADGGQAMMEPWDQPGVGRLAMVTDPQGAPFYLMNPIPPGT